MPWSGGTYTRTNGTYTGGSVWQSDAAAAIKIRADRHDTHDQDLATGINSTLNKAGQNSPTADMNWGGFKLTNLANGTAAGHAATVGQSVQKSGDTMTGALTVPALAPSAGTQGFQVVWNINDPGNGRTEYINNHGGGGGGYTWYERATSADAPDLIMLLQPNGDLSTDGAMIPGGGERLQKITLSSSAPGVLADGELFLRY